MSWVHNLYTRLMQFGYNGMPFNQVFVDEVQDFTIGEIQLLILLSTDPNSLFVTGDTAQTIARGVAFRFQDVRSLLNTLKTEYDEILEKSKVRGAARAVGDSIVVPSLKQLVVNHRTHTGVLHLAGSVIVMLKALFPYSIDALRPDLGRRSGSKPKIILSDNAEDLATLCGTRARARLLLPLL